MWRVRRNAGSQFGGRGFALRVAALLALGITVLFLTAVPADAHKTHSVKLDCKKTGTVQEGDGFRATLIIDIDHDHMVDDHASTVEAEFNTEDQTADHGDDYKRISESRPQGGVGKPRVGHDVETYEDDLLEGYETFKLTAKHIETSDFTFGGLFEDGSEDSCTVTIVDDELIAQGQTYITNLGESEDQKWGVHDNTSLAQRFQTGPNDDGYELHYVDIDIEDAPDDFDTVTITIREDSNERPGSRKIATLSVPEEEKHGVSRFYARSPLVLEPLTVYWVMIENRRTVHDDFEVWLTDSNDQFLRDGWWYQGYSWRYEDNAWGRLPGDHRFRAMKMKFHARAVDLPSVDSIDIVSDPGDDGLYGIGDEIRFRVTFTENVVLSGSSNSGLILTVSLDGTAQNVARSPFSTARKTVDFTYEVKQSDDFPGGVGVGTNGLFLDGGAKLRRSGSLDDAVLTHANLPVSSDHAVDGVRPSVTDAVASEDGFRITASFSEDISSVDKSRITIRQDGAETDNQVAVDSITGSTVVLSLRSRLTSGDMVVLDFKANAFRDQAGNGNSAERRSLTTDDIAVVAEVCGRELWSATLTPGSRSATNIIFYGWDSGTTLYTGDDLTDDDFTYDGDTYEFTQIEVEGGSLALKFAANAKGDIGTRATRNKLNLHVGSTVLNLGPGNIRDANDNVLVLSNTGLDWSTVTTVFLKITEADVSATGRPAVPGTPREGEALSADVTGIADGNGLEDVVYTYQWLKDGNVIPGAEAPDYWPHADDVGSAISVRVRFLDDLGCEEVLTSAATATVRGSNTKDVVWSATMTVGEELDFFGYDSAANPVQGALSPDTFIISGDTYTVRSIYAGESHTNFTVDTAIPVSFSLAVALDTPDKLLDSADDVDGDLMDEGHRWSFANPDWAVGDKVALAIIIPVDTPTTDTPTTETPTTETPTTGTPTTVAVPEGAPQALTASTDDSRLVKLRWVAPVDATGSPSARVTVQGYEIHVCEGDCGNEASWEVLVPSTKARRYTDKGLEGDIRGRKYRVRALRTNGEVGPWSPVVGLPVTEVLSLRAMAGDESDLMEVWINVRNPNGETVYVLFHQRDDPDADRSVREVRLRREAIGDDYYRLYYDGLEAHTWYQTTLDWKDTFDSSRKQTAADRTLKASVRTVGGPPEGLPLLEVSVDGGHTWDEFQRVEVQMGDNASYWLRLKDACEGERLVETAFDFDRSHPHTPAATVDPSQVTLTCDEDGPGPAKEIAVKARAVESYVGQWNWLRRQEWIYARYTHSVYSDGEGTEELTFATAPVKVEVHPTPILAVPDAWARESGDGSNTKMVFAVQLEPGPTDGATVRYKTRDGTATEGADYLAVSGTLDFEPGETLKVIRVTVIDDQLDDDGETFSLVLSNLQGGVFMDATGRGTIYNSDPPEEPLTGFTLVDAADQSVVATITDGATVTLDDPDGGSFGIRAEATESVEIGSVSLELSGAKTVSLTDNSAPYSLYGDDGSELDGESLPAGSYSLTATAYSEESGNGDTLGTLSVSFTVEETANTPATGAPTISGTAQVGETLTADASGITDADGLTNVSYSYQWIRIDAGTDIGIASATASTHEVSDRDAGKTIKVRVSFTDDAGNDETLTSAATGPVEETEQQTAALLSATFPTSAYASRSHSGPNDRPQVVVAFSEPVASFAAGTASVSVTGATVNSVQALLPVGLENGMLFFLVPAGNGPIGFRLVADVACADGGICTSDGRELAEVPGNHTIPGEESENTDSENTPATGAPTISGTAQAGETLTADTSGISDDDGLTGVAYSYQWIRNDAGTDSDIAGATASTYELADADVGKTIKVRVSFTDDANNQETLTSAATAAVEARPNSPATGQPTIGGTAQVDEVLTADTSGISDQDGLTGVTFNYQWLADDAEISGATGSSYTLTSSEEGKAIKVRVSFADDAGNDESLTSGATGRCGNPSQHPGHGLADHQRNGPGGPDAHGRHGKHRRRGRSGERDIQLPVDRQRSDGRLGGNVLHGGGRR